MSKITLFSTQVYKDKLSADKKFINKLNVQLTNEIYDVAERDEAGIEWSAKNYRNGFTSYASANEMHMFSPTFQELEVLIKKHVAKYISSLQLDIRASELSMSTCWVNVMPANAQHSMHNHPLSVISGTYYVQTPPNASAIRFEDPRYLFFMARPPIKPNSKETYHTHFSIPAESGHVVLFESWLKHEVPPNTSKQPRLSISFNYDWK